MADKDAVAKDYMRNEVIFADAFNFKIYGGRQVVKPQLLRPLDTTSVALLYRDDGKSEVIQRYRDILKPNADALRHAGENDGLRRVVLRRANS